jgi:hypothetical protein
LSAQIAKKQMQKLQLFRFLPQRGGVAEECDETFSRFQLLEESEPMPPEQTGYLVRVYKLAKNVYTMCVCSKSAGCKACEVRKYGVNSS